MPSYDVPSAGVAAAVCKAIGQFNAEQFWECHETLEELWIDESGPLHDFYHGLIQVAAGFVHVQRRNWHGAVHLLELGIERIEPFRPVCMGLDVDALLEAAEAWQRTLVRLGPAHMAELDGARFPRISLGETAAQDE